MTRRIIQFGTSRFLQAHVDLFVHEARHEGQSVGPIAVVKTTAGAERTGRIPAICRPEGFPVQIRGYRSGILVDDTVTVRSVDRAFDCSHDWHKVVELFATEAEIVVSNVGDRGYEVGDEDRAFHGTVSRVPASYPAKLLALLLARMEAGGRPLLILPTELVTANGQALKQIVVALAKHWRTPPAFQAWLASSVVFADGLVDRIVSGAIEPVGAIAEPYALWAIRRGGFEAPLIHRSVVMTDDLEPFERLKLHILNLGHTLLADEWIRKGRRSDQTVRQLLSDAVVLEWLGDIYASEVVPGFAARDMGPQAAQYVQTTLERFRNPFLDHRIADIAQNHRIKIDRRIGAFVTWVQASAPDMRLPRLNAVIAAAA